MNIIYRFPVHSERSHGLPCSLDPPRNTTFSDRRTPAVIVRHTRQILYFHLLWLVGFDRGKKYTQKFWDSFPSFISFCQHPFSAPKRDFINECPKKKTLLPGARENKEVVPKRTLQGLFYRHFHMNRDFEFNF